MAVTDELDVVIMDEAGGSILDESSGAAGMDLTITARIHRPNASLICLRPHGAVRRIY